MQLISFVKEMLSDVIKPLTWREGVLSFFQVSLYRNSFYLMLNSGVNMIFGFIFWLIVARYYSPIEVGLVSALAAAGALIAAFSLFGFDVSLVRFLPAEENKQHMVNSCLTITSLASIVLSLIFIAGLDLWSPTLAFMRHSIPLLLTFIFFAIASTLLAIGNSIFVAYRHAEFSLIQGVISGILRVALPIVLASAGILGLFASWGIAFFLAGVAGILLLIPRLQPKYHPLPMIKKRVISGMMRYSLTNYITMTLSMAQIFLLPLLVVNILNPEMTAYFRIAWVVASALFMAQTAIYISLLAEGSHNPESLRQNGLRAIKLSLLLAISGIIVIFVFGNKILLLFGTVYSENGFRLLQILVLSGIPLTVKYLYVTINRVEMKMRPVILIETISVVLTIGLIYALAPKFGLVGVGIGWTLSQVMITALIGAIILIQRRSRPKLKAVDNV